MRHLDPAFARIWTLDNDHEVLELPKTDRELEKCRQYIAKVSNRTEAFEDLLWALINSTEFQTKR